MTKWGMTARKGRLRREVGIVPWAPLWVLAVLIVLSSPSIASTPVTPAILYHVLANDRWGNEVRDQSSGEHQVQVRSISEPIGGGPAGMDANALGFLVAVPARIFGGLLLVAWVLRSRKH